MSHSLRWGILGTGNIARQFAVGVGQSKRGVLAAVASRETGKASAFAAANRVSAVAESYAALLSRDDVDAIYVSLPNSHHHEWTIRALEAGKHVLCEKPFAVTEVEATEMFAAADKAGRLVMEAFMYRCHPQTLAVQQVVASGQIGDLRQVRTSFCYRTTKIAGNIRFDRSLVGGSLMDVGCYCLSFSRLFLGEPVAGSASGSLHATGVDDLATGWLRSASGAVASFTCGTGAQANNTAFVCGTEGYIEVPIPWKPTGVEYTIARAAPPKQDFAAGNAPAPPPRQAIREAVTGDVYGIEADDFATSVLDGTPVRVTREETLSVARWLQQFRGEIWND